MWFMVVGKILLLYEYVWVYHLYHNIEIFYIFPLYKSYKNINKTYNIRLKIMDKYVKNLFMYNNSSVETSNTILLCNRYLYIIIYFLKFFVCCEYLFMVFFYVLSFKLCFVWNILFCFGMFYLLRKDIKCCCFARLTLQHIYLLLFWFILLFFNFIDMIWLLSDV